MQFNLAKDYSLDEGILKEKKRTKKGSLDNNKLDLSLKSEQITSKDIKSIDSVVSDNIFSDELIEHKKAIDIFEQIVPIVKCKSEFFDDAPLGYLDNQRLDGLVSGTAKELNISQRQLSRLINSDENSKAFIKSNSISGYNSIKNSESDYSNVFNNRNNSLVETSGINDSNVFDINRYSGLKKIEKIESYMKDYFSNPILEEKTDSYFKANPIYESPKYKSIDEQLYQQVITPQEASIFRKNVEDDLKFSFKKDLFFNEIKKFPFEAQLYAKAIDLGKSSLSYKDAKKEYESFYLKATAERVSLKSDSYDCFKKDYSIITGISDSYLPKKVRSCLGRGIMSLYNP
jgi:hypothetical protein